MASVALPAVGALAPVAVLQVDAGRAVQTRRRLTFIHIFKRKRKIQTVYSRLVSFLVITTIFLEEEDGKEGKNCLKGRDDTGGSRFKRSAVAALNDARGNILPW